MVQVMDKLALEAIIRLVDRIKVVHAGKNFAFKEYKGV